MKIMVVDDSPTSRRLVISALRGLGYSDFDDASDGQEAIIKLRKSNFDLLITDWNMPNLNGLELTKLVRKDPNISKLPIILITTRGDKDDLIDALKNQVDNYIVKPFTPKILKEKIDKVFEKYRKFNEEKDKILNLSDNSNSGSQRKFPENISEILTIDSLINRLGSKEIKEIRNSFKFLENNIPLDKSSYSFQNIPPDFNFVIKINYCLGKLKTTSTLQDLSGNIISHHEFE
jgi:two-component system chemotaxis response regulator CheY